MLLFFADRVVQANQGKPATSSIQYFRSIPEKGDILFRFQFRGHRFVTEYAGPVLVVIVGVPHDGIGTLQFMKKSHDGIVGAPKGDVIPSQQDHIRLLLSKNAEDLLLARSQSLHVQIGKKDYLRATQGLGKPTVNDPVMANLEGVRVVIDFTEQDERKKTQYDGNENTDVHPIMNFEF